MYLRKTTTAPMRGIDVLNPFYQILDIHNIDRSIDVLQVGAGVPTRFMAKLAGKSKVYRRIESISRILPLPERYFEVTNHKNYTAVY